MIRHSEFHNRDATPVDCETMSLLRIFLAPILETARDWDEIVIRFRQKGYGIGLRRGRLVILNEAGRPLCFGSSLGVPLAALMARLGPPLHAMPRI
ncbi:hypothetical protein [Pseudoponticoccus marisrubri]|uniref:Uncharacterized protein n=1 Tax=Pseudoponticoccus marisrubri TaxID=1685382 RepID=A0A0W7WG74_9RHOB|nr:hypothetical protein [Pseudoponticoccus marisrubri]KUF09479.1 hypothetical protein AVJ23_17715 [Pseudoponticoccus marisrubri]